MQLLLLHTVLSISCEVWKVTFQCCPCIGKDVLAKAKTGTGKTVAFLVLLLALQLVDLMSLAPTELLQSHYLAVTQSD